MRDIFEAIEEGDSGRVEAMLAVEPDRLLVRDNLNNTPLHKASWDGQVEIVKLLLRAGADVNVRGDNGRTALHFAAQENEVAVATLLIDAGADLEAVEDLGLTPLYSARGSQEAAELLVERGAQLDFEQRGVAASVRFRQATVGRESGTHSDDAVRLRTAR